MNAIEETDLLIIGTGIAGLSLARNIAERNATIKITIISKTSIEECNTNYAQGGMAVVYDFVKDSFEQHIEDTLQAGQHLNNKKVVEHVIRKGPERLKELLNWGVELDRTFSGNLDLGREGGHSQNRIVHHKDATGHEIESNLIDGILQYSNITILSSFFVTDLWVQNGACYGCIGYNKEHTVITIKADKTILATGGSGQVFSKTSNPIVATGDGVAMAIRSQVQLSNMKYIQYHPTAMYEPRKPNAFLISEAIRGFGAYVLNDKGERFLFNYTEKGELATRDIVSEAITSEMKKGKTKYVWLDCRHLNQDSLQSKFTQIYSYCLSKDYDLNTDLIPVVPAAHYQCGGITVSKKAETSLQNLYALGECSNTGLHGSNRLASNSLLEALVYAFDLSNELLNQFSTKKENAQKVENPKLKYQFCNPDEIKVFRKKIKKLMNFNVLHNTHEAVKTLQKVQKIKSEFLKQYKHYNYTIYLCETFNIILVAESILMNLIRPSKGTN